MIHFDLPPIRFETKPYDVTVRVSNLADREPCLWRHVHRIVEMRVEEQTGAPPGSVEYDKIPDLRVHRDMDRKEYVVHAKGRWIVRLDE